eukprot:7384710-Prymnesium_polylepis.1
MAADIRPLPRSCTRCRCAWCCDHRPSRSPAARIRLAGRCYPIPFTHAFTIGPQVRAGDAGCRVCAGARELAERAATREEHTRLYRFEGELPPGLQGRPHYACLQPHP